MIDFIPLPIYTPIFNWIVFILIATIFVQGQSNMLLNKNIYVMYNRFAQLFFIPILVIYMGLRPISGTYFGDTDSYAYSFEYLKAIGAQFSFNADKEWLFSLINHLFIDFGDIHTMFLFCALVYIGVLWWVCKRFFGITAYIPFLASISMFTFWSYGVNGVRTGMASSLVLLAFSYRNNKLIALLISFLALGIHKSMMLPILAACLCHYYPKPKQYLYFWIACIFLSSVVGDSFTTYFSSLGLGGDERFANYLTNTDFNDQFSSIGFRWDFLLYSSIPVIVGYYFLFKRKWDNKTYSWLYSTYLIANAFWILVIRASFSNRFAQLSWFFISFVLIYPFMKKRFWSNQSQKIVYAIVVFYLFTFYLNILK